MAGRRREVTRLIVAFRSFAKAPKTKTYTNNSGAVLTNNIGVTLQIGC